MSSSFSVWVHAHGQLAASAATTSVKPIDRLKVGLEPASERHAHDAQLSVSSGSMRFPTFASDTRRSLVNAITRDWRINAPFTFMCDKCRPC